MIKDEIKRFAQEQVLYKPQRKTIRFKGERICSPEEAAAKVAYNRRHLRHLHIAYAILRGKEPVLPTKKPYYKFYVEQLIEKYTVAE